MSKQRLYYFGLITLLVFPIPALWALWYFEEISFFHPCDFQNFWSIKTGLGIEFGAMYACFSLLILRAPFFEKFPNPIENLLQQLNLNWVEMIFLSLCAGIGEEILFRAGVQYYLGIWITSVLFVAIHGYFNPFNWRISLYGLVVLPFVVLLGYGYLEFGLWFCIAAHFAYDLVLFASIGKKK